jgi:hypothetical protein
MIRIFAFDSFLLINGGMYCMRRSPSASGPQSAMWTESQAESSDVLGIVAHVGGCRQIFAMPLGLRGVAAEKDPEFSLLRCRIQYRPRRSDRAPGIAGRVAVAAHGLLSLVSCSSFTPVGPTQPLLNPLPPPRTIHLLSPHRRPLLFP